MTAISNKFKRNHQIKDDAFSVDAIPTYTLALQTGNDSFRFCITDEAGGKCLWLEDYRFIAPVFAEQLLDQLNLIYDEHEILQAGFWKEIKLAFRNQHFTLVPQPLFMPERAVDYLQLVADIPDETQEVFFYQHTHRDMVSVFAVERRLMEWFKMAYPNKPITALHETSALMEGILHQANANTRSVAVSVEATHLTIVVTNGKQIEFCNAFYYASVPDFLYYLVLVMDELQIDPEKTKVVLYGEISHDSLIYSNLYRYVRQLSFGSKPASLRFGYKFDEVLDHRYFDVYTMHLCE